MSTTTPGKSSAYDTEVCRIGWEPMARMFGKAPGYVYKWKDELRRLGLIWYQPPGRGYRSDTGRPVHRPMVHWFASDIRAWLRVKLRQEFDDQG
jgi:hypothetical protein